MSKKGTRVPPTTTEPQQVQEQAVMQAPVELEFHAAGVNITKFQTPGGQVTVLSIVSPIGIAFTFKLSDQNVDELVKELQGSRVDVFKSMPLLTP